MYWLYILFIANSFAFFPILILTVATFTEVLTHIPDALATVCFAFSVTFKNTFKLITLHFSNSPKLKKKRPDI